MPVLAAQIHMDLRSCWVCSYWVGSCQVVSCLGGTPLAPDSTMLLQHVMILLLAMLQLMVGVLLQLQLLLVLVLVLMWWRLPSSSPHFESRPPTLLLISYLTPRPNPSLHPRATATAAVPAAAAAAPVAVATTTVSPANPATAAVPTPC